MIFILSMSLFRLVWIVWPKWNQYYISENPPLSWKFLSFLYHLGAKLYCMCPPVGVSRLMDLLADSREVIRNDVSICLWMFCEPVQCLEHLCKLHSHLSVVPNPQWCFLKLCFRSQQGLLLLQQLTKSNAAIQKIVAFENAFERLLDIITEEGSSDGGKGSLCFTRGGVDARLPFDVNVLRVGIVVEDCLLLLLNLLKNNSSNQNFFKEGSYIQRMKPWFEVGDDNSGWSAQKVTNLHLMLQVKQNARVCRL